MSFSSLGPASHPASRILLVEDDVEMAAEVQADLVDRGYSVTHREDGAGCVEAVRLGDFDLLIIDRMLPGLDGLAVVGQLRAAKLPIPVLVVSALSAVDERVRGLKAGGDDYLTKPFAMVELAARIEALLRRPLESRETVLVAGKLRVDLLDRSVHRDGQPIELQPREFRLLEYLMRRRGQVVTRDMLLEDVWHYRFVPQTNLVDVHIGRLRRKIDAPGQPPLIQSIRGAGFMFCATD